MVIEFEDFDNYDMVYKRGVFCGLVSKDKRYLIPAEYWTKPLTDITNESGTYWVNMPVLTDHQIECMRE